MAFSFTIQPAANGTNARSPIIYEVTESTATDEFKYILDVYIHDSTSVPVSYDYRLVCSVDASGNGRFDVSKIVASELEAVYSINDGTLTSRKDVGTACRYVTCKGGYIEADGTVNENEATSFSTRAYMGYLNYGQAQNTTNEAFGKISSSLPTSGFSLPYDSIFYYPISRSIISSASYTTDAGVTIPISLGSLSTSASTVGRYIPCSPTQLGLSASTEWYDLTFSDGSNTYVYRINIECEPKYDTYTVMFVNKFGFWDYLYFFKKSVETITTDKQSYKRINPDSVSYPSHITYSKDGNESLVLNTGFVSEDMNEAYKQMMLSNHIQIVEKNGETIKRPAVLEDSELTYKTGVNEQLINYTFRFSYAYDSINKTW